MHYAATTSQTPERGPVGDTSTPWGEAEMLQVLFPSRPDPPSPIRRSVDLAASVSLLTVSPTGQRSYGQVAVDNAVPALACTVTIRSFRGAPLPEWLDERPRSVVCKF